MEAGGKILVVWGIQPLLSEVSGSQITHLSIIISQNKNWVMERTFMHLLPLNYCSLYFNLEKKLCIYYNYWMYLWYKPYKLWMKGLKYCSTILTKILIKAHHKIYNLTLGYTELYTNGGISEYCICLYVQ
jgi:hypothetical protein